MNFTETSSTPYNRHYYRVIFRGGRKEIYCESWEAAQAIWFQWAGMQAVDRIEICDIRKPKPKGF